MKKATLIFVLMVLVSLFCVVAYAECPYGDYAAHDAIASSFPVGNYLGNLAYSNITSSTHTITHGLQYYCNYCSWTKIYSLNYSAVEPHDSLLYNSTILSSWNDSSKHYDETKKQYRCVCGYETDNIVTVSGSHYASGSVWIDAGHSGSVHYYDAYCAHSTCSVRFRWRTISCPGGDYHVAPNFIVNPKPVVTE